jgi:hypothetical protein
LRYRWLLLRRHGVLWAVPSRDVVEVSRAGEGAAVRVADSIWLQADELLEMTTTLEPRPLPSCAGMFETGALAGLAVWEGVPVVVLAEGAAPPAALIAAGMAGTGPDALAPAGET